MLWLLGPSYHGVQAKEWAGVLGKNALQQHETLEPGTTDQGLGD